MKLPSDNRLTQKRFDSLLRVLATLALVAALVVTAFLIARSGLASLFTVYASRSNQLPAASAAVQLNAADADAHFVRARILESRNNLSAAIAEYQQAIRIRPADYVLWLCLASAQEVNGDAGAAIAGAQEATRLAPFYARPHWLLGNILLRAGRTDEALNELRLAAAGDKELLPSTIDLEWQLSGGNADLVKHDIQPDSADSYKALAEFFKNRNKPNEAIEMLRAAGPDAEHERRQYLEELISAQKIAEAILLWSVDHPPVSNAQFIDPGFEEPINLDEPGFGWRRENKAASIMLSLDGNNPRQGSFSLRIDFSGDANSVEPILSELVPVEGATRYQMRFAFRSQEIVSGGLPYIAALDANNNIALGQSTSLSSPKPEWQDFLIEFRTAETTRAVKTVVRRQSCNTSSCPIFGHLWLDNFTLQRL